MIALAAATGVAIALALSLLRLFGGPTLYDRSLAANAVLAKAGIVCAAVAVAAGQSAWLDAAFALVLGGLVINIAILKFFRARTFQAPLAPSREDA